MDRMSTFIGEVTEVMPGEKKIERLSRTESPEVFSLDASESSDDEVAHSVRCVWLPG